ncbi:hypothetical protein [Yeosuana sp. AK3]
MKKLLDSNVFLIVLLVIVLYFIISYISTDVVLSDEIYLKYLDDKYETKYNEYKDLDIDLAEFEEELKQFEQDDNEKITYGWDYFYVDFISITAPLLIVVLGFSATFLILILFHKRLHTIKFVSILKASLISYIVFYVPIIISAIYFLIFKTNYELSDIHSFESYFKLSKFFNKETTPQWLWNILAETGFVYFIFPLIVALLLKVIYKNFRTSILVGYSYLAYIIVFIFYNTVFWYLFDLV